MTKQEIKTIKTIKEWADFCTIGRQPIHPSTMRIWLCRPDFEKYKSIGYVTKANGHVCRVTGYKNTVGMLTALYDFFKIRHDKHMMDKCLREMNRIRKRRSNVD